MFKKYWILFLIVLVAAFLRFYQLGTNPPSLTWDEVAWGYNAYSLGLNGQDEFGRFLPYNYLESFGDFKPPLYAYLDVLPIKLLGLTEFAVRFPSALFGTLTVLLTFFLTREIFSRRRTKDVGLKTRDSESSYLLHLTSYLPLIAATLLAISPWHIMLSRAAFEANVATFFLIMGVYLFLRGVHKNAWLLSFSAVSFVLAMYTFNTSRIVAPLLALMLIIGFWKKLMLKKQEFAIAAIVGLAILLPIIPFLLSDQAKLRFKEVNIFTDPEVVEMANQEIANDHNAWWSKIFHNRRLAYSVEYFHHYFDNLSPQFLFIKGDGNPKFSTQEVGQMYLWEFPFFIAGIVFLFRRREGRWWIIPLWLILGIIPAATARETPHALRIETTLPTFQIIVAYGLMQAYLVIKSSGHKVIKKMLITCFLLLLTGSFAYFWENYTLHYAKEYAGEWQYGYKDAVLYATSVENQYEKIFLTKELGRPYIYTLFYKNYSPEQFRKDAVVQRDPFGFVTVKRVGKYYFETDVIGKAEKNTLYIVTPWNVPQGANVKQTFKLPNGEDALVGYTLN